MKYESNEDKNKNLNKYLKNITLYLKGIINNLQKPDIWKLQSTITVNLISSNFYIDQKCVMHSKSDNTEIMSHYKAYEVIEKCITFFQVSNRVRNINER